MSARGERAGGAQTASVRAAQEIITAMVAVPSGHCSASIYETGRLVSLAPWLVNHAARVDYLLDRQRADGGWGGPEGYALVPTLSATEALLAVRGGLADGDGSGWSGEPDRLTDSLDRALRLLADWLDGSTAFSVPDTPATDLIIPALVDRIHTHLSGETAWRPRWWRTDGRLGLPAGMDRDRLDQVRKLLESGRALPEKLLHALEVIGPAARRAPGISPVGPGTVGASPAATAAWVGDPATRTEPDTALAYLESIARERGGPVPCATPITVFERAWVLSTLARAGVPLSVPPAIVSELRASLGPGGTPTGPGLPADADTTSVTMYALARLGHPVAPDSLWRYDTGAHFCTWQGEDGASVTTNAHVLEVLGWQAANRPTGSNRLAATVGRLTAWLCERQLPDGRWSDRWHASPYYATSCVVLALHGYGQGPTGAAVERAVEWVLATQRPEGAWGRWAGTAEETAYALHVLAVSAAQRPAVHSALERGARWLAEAGRADEGPALWHDKDLYRPSLIVRAAVLAAGQFARVTGYVPARAVPLRSADHMIRIA